MVGSVLSYQAPRLSNPAWWIGSLDVGVLARLLLAAVAESCVRQRRVAPGERALAELYGCSTRTVRRAVRELREAGLIRVVYRGRGRKALLLLTRVLWYRFTGRVPRLWPRAVQQSLTSLLGSWGRPLAGWESYADPPHRRGPCTS